MDRKRTGINFVGCQGFTLGEMIASMAILGLLAWGTVEMMSVVTEHQHSVQAETQESSFNALQQGIVAQGFDPSETNPILGAKRSQGTPSPSLGQPQSLIQNGTGGEQDGHSGTVSRGTNTTPQNLDTDITLSTRKVSDYAGAIEVFAFEGQAGSGKRLYGQFLEITGTALPPKTYTLTAPQIVVRTQAGIEASPGPLQINEFPIDLTVQHPVVAAGQPNAGTLLNPPGTFYRYTVDGSVPSDTSPIWTGTVNYNIDNFPSRVRVKTYHSDPLINNASAVAERILTVDLGTIFAYKGSASDPSADVRINTSIGWTLDEVLQDGNLDQFVFFDAPSGVAISNIVVRYTMDGSAVTAASPSIGLQTNIIPPAPGSGLWGGGVRLRYQLYTTDSRYLAGTEREVILNAIQEELPAPTFSPGNITRYNVGTTIQADSNGGNRYGVLSLGRRTNLNDPITWIVLDSVNDSVSDQVPRP